MENNRLREPDVIKEEIAIEELQKFVERFTYEKPEDWKVKEDYPQALTAVRKGLLSFDSKTGKPKYDLAFPLGIETDMPVTTVDFRTRIKPFDLANITKGLNVQKQQVEYTIICLSYLSRISKGELNKLEKFDYKVIEQVSTVFF